MYNNYDKHNYRSEIVYHAEQLNTLDNRNHICLIIMLLPLALFVITSLLGIASTADSGAVAQPNYEWSEQYDRNTDSQREKRQITPEGEYQSCKSISFFRRPHP